MFNIAMYSFPTPFAPSKGSTLASNSQYSIFKVRAKSNTQNPTRFLSSSLQRDETQARVKSILSKPIELLTSVKSSIYSKIPLHPSVDPEHVLTGNFAPVGETPPTECLVVEGEIHPFLNGVYIRNGPNPQHNPVGPYHLWSGDGMLHSIRLSNGRAIFCSRFVKTCKYEVEQAKGYPIIPNIISGFYGLNDICNSIMGIVWAIAKRVDIVKAFGVANTSLAILHGDLYAIADGGRPYMIRLTREGDIETLHEYDYASKAPLNMTAHPKTDLETEEVFAFQIHVKYPYLTFFRFNPDSSNWENVPMLSINYMCFVHDFSITKNYAIFFDTQLEVALLNLLKFSGIPISYEPRKVSRIGILPRHATSDSEMRWFRAPGLNAFHILNGWEEDDDHIVMITPTYSSPNDILYKIGDFFPTMEKLIINTKTGDLSRTILSDRGLEMGSINTRYQGKKNRYLYMSIHPGSLLSPGIVKIDLELECEVAIRYYGPNCYGGEPSFVPRHNATASECEEDDGFLVSYVHNESTNESFFVVMDAKSLEFVCKVKLPGRVPYGLHGLFLNEEQLESLSN